MDSSTTLMAATLPDAELSPKPFQGLYAAMGTPRDEAGRLDLNAAGRWVEFLREQSITSIVLNGATGECCATSPDDVRALLRHVIPLIKNTGQVLCGIGSGSYAHTIALGEIACEEGADGLLLSMPYFFPYAQYDLAAFAIEAAEHLKAPMLLYNLPSFTTPLEPQTVLEILNSSTYIKGIKDSAGSTAINTYLTTHKPDVCRIVGNDNVFSESQSAEICDGLISGVASVFPRLMHSLYHHPTPEAEAELAATITQLNQFPTPWGIKFLAAQQGILTAAPNFPLSPARREQCKKLQAWFDNRLEQIKMPKRRTAQNPPKLSHPHDRQRRRNF